MLGLIDRIAQRQILRGHKHIDRGVLSPEGESYRSIAKMALYEMHENDCFDYERLHERLEQIDGAVLGLGKKPVAAEIVGRNVTARMIDAESCWQDVCLLRSYKTEGPIATCEMAFARAALTKALLCERQHPEIGERISQAADALVLRSFTGQDTPASRAFYGEELAKAAPKRVALYSDNVFPHSQLAAILGRELGVPGIPSMEASFMFENSEERV
ncbi:MAG: hypothetical protein H0V67_00280, partial [Geodermatophilaceae bacterium]|nr:hypothetical protein [Geodermatophilaceae bacterium]